MTDTELIARAYAAYDSDPRVHGPDGYEAFAEAVQQHVTAYLQEHIMALHTACEAVDRKLTPEAGSDDTIVCYIMPAGVWHQVLGLCRGRHT